MGLFDMFKGSKEVYGCWFPVNNEAIDTSIQLFGKLCYELAKVVPEERREDVVIRVVVDRDEVTAKLSIDTLAVDLQKKIPGYKLAELYGWKYNSRYLEGIAQRITLPDAWGYATMTENIIREFRKGFPNAQVVNRSNDTNDIEWVIFHAVIR